MKIIAAVNNKGGVGKTKTLTVLAEYISKYMPDKRVLGIDFDSQCNFSKLFLSMELDPAAPEGVMPPIHSDYDPNEDEDDGRSSIANIFFGKSFLPYTTRLKNFDLAPGHAYKLLEVEAVRRTEVEEKVHRQVELLLNSQEVQESYDIVLVDTAPSKGPLTVSTIKSATHIFVPTLMEEQPIQGMYGMLQLWMQEAPTRTKVNPLNLIGILPNMFDKTTSLHTSMLNSLMDIESVARYIMPVKLGRRIVFAETDAESSDPKTVFDLPKNNTARQEALQFCEYVMNRVYEHG